ncbi:MAG TPA: hypothetical protein VED17_01830 [Nitrososphaerales archaeon]|nr:hypothetical protein [Nitrososphaerales archaeon]
MTGQLSPISPQGILTMPYDILVVIVFSRGIFIRAYYANIGSTTKVREKLRSRTWVHEY